MKKLFLILSVIIISAQLFSQNAIDSLENVLKNTQNISEKVTLLNKLSIKYRAKDLDKSKEYAQKAYKLAEKEKDYKNVVLSLHNLGKAHLYSGTYEDALKNYQLAAGFCQKINNDTLLGLSLHSIGNSYLYLTKYDEAIEHYLRALKIREKINDLEGIAASTNNIGLIYWNLEDFPNALTYYKKSLDYEIKANNKKGMASSYNNLGLVYWKQDSLDLAIECITKGQKLHKENGNIRGQASSYNNLGILHRTKKEYPEAIESFQKALDIYEALSSKENIANMNNNIGSIYLSLGELQKAKKYFLEAKKNAEAVNAIRLLKENAGYLGELYKQLGDYKNAYYAQISYTALKDSLFNIARSEQIADMQTKYDTEKKENEIKIQQALIKKQDAENKFKSLIIWALGAVFIVIVIFSILFYKQLKEKKRANKKLMLQNAEITQQREEIQAQADNLELANSKISEINEQLIGQNKIIKRVNEHTRASINYALTIQQAMLPLDDVLTKYFRNFVIYLPKDIVSGDFYWHRELTDTKHITNYLAVVDCTGHGVPGAFMSMIGIRLLNDIISERKIYTPKEILETLDAGVIKALRQDIGENRDGMDVCFCKIETLDDTRRRITYAGAKRDLVIYNAESKELTELKGARRSIGNYGSRRKTDFTEFEITLHKNDVIYLSSDGYTDQNNQERKRFGKKRLYQLYSEIGSLDIKEQEQKLLQELKTYQADEPQRDDITVIGVKL